MINMSEDQKKKLSKVLSNATGVTAFAVSFYVGAEILWLPLLSMTVVWFCCSRLVKNEQRSFFVPAFSILTGYLVWLADAMIITEILELMIDVTLILISVTWIMARPGLKPVIYSSAVLILHIIINITVISDAKVNSLAFKALLAHIGIKVFALAFLWQGYSRLCSFNRQTETDADKTIPHE